MEFTFVWHLLSIFGDIQYWVGFAVCSVIIYLLLSKRSKERVSWIIFLLLPAAFFSYQLSYLLKIWFKVPRPCIGLDMCPLSYSFPSGHAAVIFAFATMSMMNTKKKWLWASVILLAFLVSASRIFLNYHNAIDVFSGAVVGITCAYIVQETYKTFLRIKQ